MKPIEIIKAAGEKIGWNELQEILGVTRQTIWNWKSGARENPSGKVVLKCLEIINGREQIEHQEPDARTIEFL